MMAPANRDTALALPAELVAQLRRIQLQAKHRVSDVLSGHYQSAFKGRGMELEEVREYVPGDDVRHIDWNVTARMSSPYVKLHREERELTLLLMVDQSASGAFGTATRARLEAAAEASALLAYLALRNNDRVGLMLFDHEVEHYIPPKKGRSHVWRVIRDILAIGSSHAERSGTSIAEALAFLGRVQRRRAIVFLVSDFFDRGAWDTPLALAALRHQIAAVRLIDPGEQTLPEVGIVHLQDLESGAYVELDTSDAGVRQGYARAFAAERTRQAQILRRAGVDCVDIVTSGSTAEPLVRYLRRGGAKR